MAAAPGSGSAPSHITTQHTTLTELLPYWSNIPTPIRDTRLRSFFLDLLYIFHVYDGAIERQHTLSQSDNHTTAAWLPDIRHLTDILHCRARPPPAEINKVVDSKQLPPWYTSDHVYGDDLMYQLVVEHRTAAAQALARLHRDLSNSFC